MPPTAYGLSLSHLSRNTALLHLYSDVGVHLPPSSLLEASGGRGRFRLSDELERRFIFFLPSLHAHAESALKSSAWEEGDAAIFHFSRSSEVFQALYVANLDSDQTRRKLRHFFLDFIPVSVGSTQYMMVWKNFPLPPLHGVLLGLYPPVACTSSKSTVCSIIGGAGQFHWSSDLYLRLYPHFTSEDRSDLYAPTFGALRKSWRFIHRFESRRVHLRSNLTEREGLILLIRAYFKWILPEYSKFFEPVPLFSSSPSTSRSLKCACSRRLDLRRQRISRKPRGLYASVLQKRRKWFQLRGRAIMPPDLEESEDDMAETELEEQDAYWRYDEEEEQRLRRQFGLSISCRGAATEYSDEKNSAALKEELQAEEDGAVNADGQDDGCLEEELENDIVLRSLWPPPHHDLEKETLKRSGKRRWVEDKADEGIRRKRRRVAYR